MKESKKSPEGIKGVPEELLITPSEMAQRLAELINNHLLCVITGPSGSGKTKLTFALKKTEKTWLILEDYADNVNGKYISTPPEAKLNDAMIVSGASDNLFDMVDDMMTRRESSDRPLKGLCLFFIAPSFELFVQSNALKAKEDTAFAEEFARRGSLSDSDFRKFVFRVYKNDVSALSKYAAKHELPFTHFVVLNTADGKVVEGWHEDTLNDKTKGGKNEK